MPHRLDAFEDYVGYEGMTYHSSVIDYLYDEIEQGFSNDFTSVALAERRQRELEMSAECNDDFWDIDPFFWSITSDQDWKKMEELMAQTEASSEVQDHEFFRFETQPLRHEKKRRFKLKLSKQ